MVMDELIRVDKPAPHYRVCPTCGGAGQLTDAEREAVSENQRRTRIGAAVEKALFDDVTGRVFEADIIRDHGKAHGKWGHSSAAAVFCAIADALEAEATHGQ